MSPSPIIENLAADRLLLGWYAQSEAPYFKEDVRDPGKVPKENLND